MDTKLITVFSKGIFLFLMTVVMYSCKSDPTPKTATEPKTKLSTPSFVADSAYANIQRQLDFGFRVPGTAAHKEMQERR